MTMQLFSTVTVGSGGVASIEFTSIPATGKDLLVVLSGRASGSDYAATLYVQVNNNTSSIYKKTYLTGYNNNVQTAKVTAGTEISIQTQIPGALATSNTFGNASIYFPDYAGSNEKQIHIDSASENNANQAAPGILTGLWANTAALTSIKLSHDSGNFVQYSTASLYIIS